MEIIYIMRMIIICTEVIPTKKVWLIWINSITKITFLLCNRKLRTQVQVKLFLNLCTALIVLYIIYIGALYARNHTTSCIVFSALFHYVFLVVLIALIGDIVYSLATLTTIPSENYHLFVACISWSKLY